MFTYIPQSDMHTHSTHTHMRPSCSLALTPGLPCLPQRSHLTQVALLPAGKQMALVLEATPQPCPDILPGQALVLDPLTPLHDPLVTSSLCFPTAGLGHFQPWLCLGPQEKPFPSLASVSLCVQWSSSETGDLVVATCPGK